MRRTRKITYIALTAAVAMVLSFIESQIPTFVAIPGVKVGLANIAVVFALYKFGFKEAIGISLVRIFTVAMLFGSVVTLAYSTAGALLSLVLMMLLKKAGVFGEIGVSVVGGISHNIGQITVACILLETNVVIYYLPFLILSGTVAGIVVGLAAALIIKRVDY